MSNISDFCCVGLFYCYEDCMNGIATKTTKKDCNKECKHFLFTAFIQMGF